MFFLLWNHFIRSREKDFTREEPPILSASADVMWDVFGAIKKAG
jgi:hypothetical protein